MAEGAACSIWSRAFIGMVTYVTLLDAQGRRHLKPLKP